MKKLYTKIISITLLGFILIFVAYHVFSYFFGKNKVEVAIQHTVSDQMSIVGIAFRDEKVINISNNGIVNYFYDNAEKISKDSIVAKIYQTSQDAINENLTLYIDNELMVIENAIDTLNGNQDQPDLISKQIQDLHTNLILDISKNNVLDIYKIRQSILGLQIKREQSMNANVDYSDRIKQLNQYKSELQNKISSVPEAVRSDYSGYFINSTDGYENFLNNEMVDNLDLIEFNKLFEQININVDYAEHIGKVVTDSITHFIISVDNDMVNKFTKGNFIDITREAYPNYKIEMSIKDIKYNKDQNQNLIVLYTDNISKEVLDLRKEQVDLSFRDTTGLKVPKKSIRIQDGQKYVYVKDLNSTIKKNLDVIYETKDYVLSKINNTDKNYLQPFDDIIINAK